MQAQHTSPTIRDAITTSLLTWGEDIVPSSERSAVQALMQAQQTIGWFPILFGFIHKAWTEHQQAYLQALGSKKHPARWTRMLIQKMFNIAWDMWDHRNHVKHHGPTAARLRHEDDINQKVRAQFDLGSENLLRQD